MAQTASRRTIPVAAALVFASLSACVDERVVFRDRDLFDTPPTQAMGFLGYTDHTTQRTACGSCHTGEQKRWEEHAHAHAWQSLGPAGQNRALCVSCHTVNQLGNAVTENAGYLAFPAERYRDVQCESCHGPGLDHARNPDLDRNHPLAPIAVGTDLSTGCGQCHGGAHHPYVDEWSASAHGRVNAIASSRPGCNSCHEGKAALRSFGVTNSYTEAFSSTPQPITCAVCHDPHGNENASSLRFRIDVPSPRENLCAVCHNRRSVPDPSSPLGLRPHAPEGAMLFGEAGWFPPGLDLEPGRIVSSHGSEGNPKLCATCHVNSIEVTDPEGITIRTTGHSFQAIPCKGPNGLPVQGDCELSTQARDFSGCTGAGCHLTEQAAFSATFSASTDLRTSAQELLALLRLVDPNLDAPGGEIDPTTPVFTVAEGALYNYYLAAFGGPGRKSPLMSYAAAAVHNPFLMRSLLAASRDAVRSTYDLPVGVAPVPPEQR